MPNSAAKDNIPTVLVIFGATGDLVARKITPALFHLFLKGKLPSKFRVLGTARRAWFDDDLRRHVAEIIKRHIKLCKGCAGESSEIASFMKLFSYQSGNFDRIEDYRTLNTALRKIDSEWKICANKLFYLAVPPELYETMFKNLSVSGLTDSCSPKEGWTPLEAKRLELESKYGKRNKQAPSADRDIPEEALTGWTRVIVEKPFGRDLKTARRLDSLLGKLFREIQIYRIDHYLGKEMTQNILAFRFSNNLFESGWGKGLIEKIEIRLLEKSGAEDRGSFYESVGALRDVGQNHLLQMLAFLTMDHPINFTAEAIRRKRADVLKTLRTPSAEEVRRETFRAQYEGYLAVRDVAPASRTETYFKAAAHLDSQRWRGVWITLESGKRLGDPLKEIVITFRHPSPCLCFPVGEKDKKEGHHQNRIVIRFEPKEEIEVQFWPKKPGLQTEVEKRELKFRLREKEKESQYTEEYEKLLLDCILGDQTLFVGTEEVSEMWRYVDPILRGWIKNTVPLKTYKPDAKDVTEEARRVIDGAISPVIASDQEERGNLAGFPATTRNDNIKKEIGMIGLGKMGGGIARQLMEKGWGVVGFNRTKMATGDLVKEGLIGAHSIEELAEKLAPPRVIWLMVPSYVKTTKGKPAKSPVEDVLEEITEYLERGDIVIDGGNSFYKDSERRARRLAGRGIKFMDVGVSGGPAGARHGASLMVGGDKKTFEKLEGLFADLSVPDGYCYIGVAGAGHFVKMVHNGIEYGMMQALAEGFQIMKQSRYRLNLKDIARVYNHGSVIESRLVGWLQDTFEIYGENLKNVSGSVRHTGEGAWTVETAKEMRLKTKVIEEALKFRIASGENPSYAGKILSALRNRFGGHDVSAKQ